MALHTHPLRCAATRLGPVLVLVAFGVTPGQVRGQCDATQTAKLTAFDAVTEDRFGEGVAMSGDTVIVGAHQNEQSAGVDAGAAYVFVRTGGTWTLQQKLIPSDAAAGDVFGASVAISGDTVVIGAPGDDNAGGNNVGAVYVYTRMSGVWNQQAKLTASDPGSLESFGQEVAVDDDTIIVGSQNDSHAGGALAGSVYVYVRCGVSWSQQQKLIPSDVAPNDNFGSAVAIHGNYALIGALFDDTVGVNAGSAYIFVRAGTIWIQSQKLTPSDAEASDNFGEVVDLHENTAIIGASQEDSGGTSAGAAYVFVRSGAVWSQQAKLTASDALAGDQLGRGVSISGDNAVVSASGDNHSGLTAPGSAYFFVRTGSTWAEEAKMTASDAANSDLFGDSVDVDGGSCIISAILDDHTGATNTGSSYIFDLVCDSDGDGVANSADVCPNNAPGLPVDCAGRPLRDCNHDCVVNGADIDCIVAEMLG